MPWLDTLVSKHQSHRCAPKEDQYDFGNKVDRLQHARRGDHAAVVGEDAVGAKNHSGDAGYDCRG